MFVAVIHEFDNCVSSKKDIIKQYKTFFQNVYLETE